MERITVKRSILVFTSLLLIALLVTACGEPAKANISPTRSVQDPAPTAPVRDEPDMAAVSLADALRSADAPVELIGEVTQPFFAVTGQLFKVFDGEVQVFEFESEIAAKEQAAQVSPDGGSVGTSMMSWMATPHFYHEGKWLVLYVGDDRAIIDLLETVLGPQFAGGMSEAAEPPTPGIDGCPPATADTRVLTDEAHGYCLLYPITHKVEKPNADETILVIGGLLNASDPRVHIVVEKADGRSAEQMADAWLAAVDGFDVSRTSTTVGGVEAVVLDKLPGQEINRQVWFVYDGRLYQMMFSPADEGLGEPYTRMEALYALITDSFTFIPVSDAVVPGADCLEATADTQSLTFEAHNFCILYPTGYDIEEPTANQIVLYVGSLLNVEHPKAFIEVGDAGGRTAEQVADELVAEVQASMPGYTVERTFGLTVGYEPAWVLENMPGQDISRQVVFVHDGQLYRLTFVPADASAGEVYSEMEDLYATVINSFRFLR